MGVGRLFDVEKEHVGAFAHLVSKICLRPRRLAMSSSKAGAFQTLVMDSKTKICLW
jgi:hypothetical protein